MKILIVEDDLTLRKMLAATIKARRPAAKVLEAGTLGAALATLPDADAVLSDGSFPTRAGRQPEPAETQSGNWAPVMMACDKAAKPYVLLTGSGRLVSQMRAKGHQAFHKPDETAAAVLAVIHLADLSSDPPATERGAGEKAVKV